MTDRHQNDDYLWDPAAPVDSDVAHLERVLAGSRFDPDRVPLPRGRLTRRPTRWRLVAAAAAALILLVTGAAGYRWTWPEGKAWPMSVTGRVAAGDGALVPGEPLRLGPGEQARVSVARIGVLEASPGSDLLLRATASNDHRMMMNAGDLRVRVWAPPGSLSIVTPAGEVVDLGCAFRLGVSESGEVSVTVESGWVLLNNAAGEMLVPAGASSGMRSGRTPLAPVFDDATPGFQAGSRALEGAMADSSVPMPPLAFLAEARPRDVLTLLTLADVAPAGIRDRLVERAAELSPPPDRVRLLDVAEGDEEQLWQWIGALDLPPAKRWWFNWRDGFSG